MRIYIIITIMVSSLSFDAFAINKCTNRNGSITYTDRPCEKDSSIETISLPTSEPKPQSSAPKGPPPQRQTAEEVMSSGNWNLVQTLIGLQIQVANRIGTGSSSEANACLEKYRNIYKDPQSAYVVSFSLYENEVNKFLHVDVSAKNGFGGAVRSNLICSVEVFNAADRDRTKAE